ncbi:MAG: gas vesicle protein K [Cyclobacteriaceae bacterium]
MTIDEQKIESKINDLTERLQLNPEDSANGLVKLVLSLVNTIKEVMELQSLRKIENNELSEDQIERVGATFLALDEKMKELREHFGLSAEDLDIDLNKYIKVE